MEFNSINESDIYWAIYIKECERTEIDNGFNWILSFIFGLILANIIFECINKFILKYFNNTRAKYIICRHIYFMLFCRCVVTSEVLLVRGIIGDIMQNYWKIFLIKKNAYFGAIYMEKN